MKEKYMLSRQQRFEGIKKHKNELWEDCEDKIYDLLKK